MYFVGRTEGALGLGRGLEGAALLNHMYFIGREGRPVGAAHREVQNHMYSIGRAGQALRLGLGLEGGFSARGRTSS